MAKTTVGVKASTYVAVMVLTLAACSRSGSLSGDVFVQTPPGEVNPAARISVSAIRTAELFAHDWATRLAAFQAEIEPARKAQQAAAAAVEEARLVWDGSLAAGRGGPAGASQRHKGPRTSPRERRLWEQLRAAEHVLFQAKRQVWEVARKHDGQADSLVDAHSAARTNGCERSLRVGRSPRGKDHPVRPGSGARSDAGLVSPSPGGVRNATPRPDRGKPGWLAVRPVTPLGLAGNVRAGGRSDRRAASRDEPHLAGNLRAKEVLS